MTRCTTTTEFKSVTLAIALTERLEAEFISTLSSKLHFSHSVILFDGENLIEELSHQPPDFLLLDPNLPNLGCMGFLKKIQRINLPTNVILYDKTPNPNLLRMCLSIPQVMFIQKGCGIDDFQSLLAKAISGNKIIYVLNERNPKKVIQESSPTWDILSLTEREIEVLSLLRQGLIVRKIAEQLCISESTVNTHKTNISRKFGLSKADRLSLLAIRDSRIY
jgi:DNA-binding NarL/FixJ family response regulator